jgi:hypothetical protein
MMHELLLFKLNTKALSLLARLRLLNIRFVSLRCLNPRQAEFTSTESAGGSFSPPVL